MYGGKIDPSCGIISIFGTNPNRTFLLMNACLHESVAHHGKSDLLCMLVPLHPFIYFAQSHVWHRQRRQPCPVLILGVSGVIATHTLATSPEDQSRHTPGCYDKPRHATSHRPSHCSLSHTHSHTHTHTLFLSDSFLSSPCTDYRAAHPLLFQASHTHSLHSISPSTHPSPSSVRVQMPACNHTAPDTHSHSTRADSGRPSLPRAPRPAPSRSHT